MPQFAEVRTKDAEDVFGIVCEVALDRIIPDEGAGGVRDKESVLDGTHDDTRIPAFEPVLGGGREHDVMHRRAGPEMVVQPGGNSHGNESSHDAFVRGPIFVVGKIVEEAENGEPRALVVGWEKV